jgi:hypothetical protein
LAEISDSYRRQSFYIPYRQQFSFRNAKNIIRNGKIS